MFVLPWGDPPGKTRLWWQHDWRRHTSWHQAHLHQPEHIVMHVFIQRTQLQSIHKKSSTLQSIL